MSIQSSVSRRLEIEPALTGTVGERLHAPVVLIAATVEHRGGDTGGLRTLGQRTAHLLGLVRTPDALELLLGPVDRGQGTSGLVIDQLCRDALVGAEHGDTRTL